jgi:carbonic anhydrase
MHDDVIEEVAHLNVELSITRIKQESSILAEMEEKGEIEIVGAMYDVNTGLVEFI